MDTKVRKLSLKIKALLAEHCIQQKEIAQGLKVSKQYLANVLNIDPKKGGTGVQKLRRCPKPGGQVWWY